MGERYTKEEGGKEVVYERGVIFDTKVGEVRDSSSFSDPSVTKEIVDTSGLCDRVVGRIERESIFSNGREATINGEEGTFNQGYLESNPTFKLNEKGSYEGHSASNYSSSSSGSSASSMAQREASITVQSRLHLPFALILTTRSINANSFGMYAT